VVARIHSRNRRATLAKGCGAQTAAPHYSRGVKTILAPIDFSGVTDAVVAAAAELARAFNGTVVLFTVVQPPTMVTEYAPLLADAADVVAAGE
jgi:hypothetical protein